MLMLCNWPKCESTAFYETEITHCEDEDGSEAIDVVFCERHYQKVMRYRC